MQTGRHRVVSAGIYYFAFTATVFAVAIPTALAATYLPGWWAAIAGILTFVVMINLSITGWSWLRRRRADAFYRLAFPAYDGYRTYCGTLLQAQVPGSIKRYTEVPQCHAIGDGGDALFIIANAKSQMPHSAIGGRMVNHPSSSEPWRLDKARITYIGVDELSDAAIERHAVDPSSEVERVVEAGLLRVIGIKNKRTIIPFAAYIDIRLAGAAGEEQLLFGIPTEISNETLQSFGVAQDPSANALVAAAISKAVHSARDAGLEAVHDRASAAVGETLSGAFDTVADVKRDFESVLSLGAAAQIGSTNGARGRVLARLAAERIREQAGISSVHITRLAD